MRKSWIMAIFLIASNAHAFEDDYMLNLEAPLLRKYPEMAQRKGSQLKLYMHGKEVWRNDTDLCIDASVETEDKNCWLAYFMGKIDLIDEQTRKKITHPFIRIIGWEWSADAIVKLNGGLFLVNGIPLASPNGHTIAAGSDSVDEESEDNQFMIAEWGSDEVVTFSPSCLPQKWIDQKRVQVLCEHYFKSGLYRFEAIAHLDIDGKWRLSATKMINAPEMPLAEFEAIPNSTVDSTQP